MRPPDKREPAAFPLTGSLEIDVLPGKIDLPHHTDRHAELQVDRLLRHWRLSLPLAHVVAELAFGQGRAA